MPDERDSREIADLRERARKARVVAHHVSDNDAKAWLRRYAEELESRADELEANVRLPSAAAVLSPSEPMNDNSEPEPA